MNCVLFAKMDPVFSLKKIEHEKILEKWQKILEKSGNFVIPEKWEPWKRVKRKDNNHLKSETTGTSDKYYKTVFEVFKIKILILSVMNSKIFC